MMNNKEFVEKLKKVATDYKTLYVMGCLGSPLKGENIKRYCNNYAYNRQNKRTAMIKAAGNQNPPVYGFDCVCLIKAILWGWDGDPNHTYGGASYATNGVPDIGADKMITKCSDLSTNFSNIEIGEAVWTNGHIGIYIGDGLAVECTPSWDNDVQITACNCSKTGYNRRDWKKHGKLPYIEYAKEEVKVEATKKSIDELAKEVLNGEWGNGADRRTRLTAKGYDYSAVQKRVNELLAAPKKKSIDEIAREVINGKWGNGSARKKKLTEAGYDYSLVQKRVNELL
jgi:hypothetical protein